MMTHLLCRPSTPIPFLSRVAEVAEVVAAQRHTNDPDQDDYNHKTELRAKITFNKVTTQRHSNDPDQDDPKTGLHFSLDVLIS